LAATFSQTLRAFSADRSRRTIVTTFTALVLLGAWGVWFFRAKVAVYETSEVARLEVDRAAHTIDAPVSGQIVATRLTIGAVVHEGEIVLELDSEVERGRLREEEARLAAIGPEIEALERALSAQEQSVGLDRGATGIALDEARARKQEADVVATLAQDEAARARMLHDRGEISDLELLQKRAEADRRRAGTDALTLDVARQNGDQKTREIQTRVRIEDVRRDIASAKGRSGTSVATIAFLRHEIERRTVRASVGGRVGDVADLRPGAYVREGDKLGAIVPPGDIQVVAEFLPAAAGRIRPGQTGRVRLEGYPWLEYGTLPANVTRVGSELRAGRMRVELSIPPNGSSAIPLQHGLPGSVEIEVEQVTPESLVLRAAGKVLAQRTTPSPAPPATVLSLDRHEGRP
jgi:membrane fusion protein (multidrug efflux system)